MKTLDALFRFNAEKKYTRFSLEDFLDALTQDQDLGDGVLNRGKELVGSISNEDFSDLAPQQLHVASRIFDDLTASLEHYGFTHMKEGNRYRTENQVRAAAMAAIACGDTDAYKKALRQVAKRIPGDGENVISVEHRFDGPFGSMQVFQDHLGLENYNEKSQRDFRVVTVGYNLEASRQDEFAERLYPTTVINPTEGGVVQVLPYIAVLKDVYHQVTGQKMPSEEVNMVEAYRDPSILDDNCTDLIPAVDPNGTNLKYFVDNAVIPHETITNQQNLTFTTAPLKPGVGKFDLMGISNANQLRGIGMLDVSDTIDPSGRLRALYVEIKGKIVKFTVDRLPTAVFQPGLIGDTRLAKLDFITEDLVLGEGVKSIDNQDIPEIQALVARKWSARVAVNFNGNVATQTGLAQYGVTSINIDRIVNDKRQNIDITTPGGDGEQMVTSFGELKVIGFELDVKFTNTNRRQRGHLLQSRAIQFRHPIPMHAPVTLPMSTMDEQGPGDIVHALTVNTNIRNSNNAVKRLLNYVAQLKEVVGNGYDRPKFGAVEGALSIMMRPTYREGTLHVPDHVDTLKSQDRWQDVCSTILNYAKGILFPAYRESNIEAAYRVVSGNQDEKPMFIFATDKEIGNYLMTQGDDRTLGAILKYDLVTTNNELFDGKLIIVPTRENPVENDILTFGQFFYVSTVIADLPITRGGQQVTREIAAIPFNLHVNNIPFAINLTITGLEKVMGESQWNKPLIDAVKAP